MPIATMRIVRPESYAHLVDLLKAEWMNPVLGNAEPIIIETPSGRGS